MGNTSVIEAEEFQHMYAGTGVVHSEMNASDAEPVHFLQIWIIPEQTGGTSSYFQIKVDLDEQPNSFVPVAGPDEHDGRAMLRSDTWIYMARLQEGSSIRHDFEPGRAGFLQVVQGIIEIEGHRLSAGDGLQFDATSRCDIEALSDAELMLIDLS